MSKKLGELVKLAKGEDRTIKEYGRDAGVDPAIISKIIAGKYLPKKPKMLKDLTSISAAPRNDITYEMLIKASRTEDAYKAGVAAGLGAVTTMMPIVGGVALSMLLTGENAIKPKIDSIIDGDDLVEKTVANLLRFSAAAVGIIYGRLAQKGIVFRPEVDKSKRLMTNEIDTYITIENQDIEEYILGYVYLDKDDINSDYIVENIARQSVERLLFIKSNEKRKVSIVVNSKEVYNYLLQYKGAMSYRGNLSIILFDLDKINIEREEYLALYDEDKEKPFLLV